MKEKEKENNKEDNWWAKMRKKTRLMLKLNRRKLEIMASEENKSKWKMGVKQVEKEREGGGGGGNKRGKRL